jgi:L-asparaginase II
LSSKILTNVTRGNTTESHHSGWIAVCDKDGNLINGTHHKFPSFFARSSLKPVQALPFLFAGGMETFKFSSEELASISSSHSGEHMHTEVVSKILSAIKLTEKDLKCGVHIPYGNEIATQLIREDKQPTEIHCNCSGKHAGMLATCLINGWDITNYFEYDHPLQKEIRKHMTTILELDADKFRWGVDGCGVPTYSFPLDSLAKLFSRIMNPSSLPKEYHNHFEKLKEAFLAHPELIAGKDRIDTVIMKASNGQVLSKIGGEAVIGVALLKEEKSFAIKVEDGANRPMIPVIISTMEKLGFDVKNNETLSNLRITKIENNLKDLVGKVIPTFNFVK